MNEQTWVYLVRHGETDWNLLRRWQGHSITPLNPLGQRQAELVARRLAGKGLTTLYSSDSTRALQTAGAIAATTGLPIKADARLREIDVGIYQGHTRAEIEAVDGERLAARGADPFYARMPGGESWADLIARVEEAFEQIVAAHAGERVAVVTHGGPIGVILYTVNGRSSEELLHSGIENTAVTLLRGRPGAWEIVLVNDMAHLEGFNP
jgi:broad specificity phosphatase PhoE